MPYLIVRLRVEDYARWNTVYDEHAPARKASGFKGGIIFRNADNPNELFPLLEVDDHRKARQFFQSEDTQEAMQRAGLADKPDVYFLDEVDRPSVRVKPSPARRPTYGRPAGPRPRRFGYCGLSLSRRSNQTCKGPFLPL